MFSWTETQHSPVQAGHHGSQPSQYLLTVNTAADVLAGMKVSELPGVGRSMETRLASQGVVTVADLLTMSLARLQQECGAKTGTTLYNMARGRELEHVRKTVTRVAW